MKINRPSNRSSGFTSMHVSDAIWGPFYMFLFPQYIHKSKKKIDVITSLIELLFQADFFFLLISRQAATPLVSRPEGMCKPHYSNLDFPPFSNGIYLQLSIKKALRKNLAMEMVHQRCCYQNGSSTRSNTYLWAQLVGPLLSLTVSTLLFLFSFTSQGNQSTYVSLLIYSTYFLFCTFLIINRLWYLLNVI